MLRGKGRWIRACASAFCLESALATAGPLPGVELPLAPPVDATPATTLSVPQVQLANLAYGVLSEVRSAGAPAIVMTRTANSNLIAYAIDSGMASALPGGGQRPSVVNAGGLDGATAIVEDADGQIMLVHEVVDAVISLLFPQPRAESAPEEKPANYRPVGAADYAAADDGRAAGPAEKDDGDGGLIKRRTKRSTAAAKECR